MDEAEAHAAIGEAFARIERVHALMSFHEPGSDLSRLHRSPLATWITLDPMTIDVLGEAIRLSACSDGVFDITIGARLVQDGLLPPPQGARTPDPAASWRDIELSPTQVRLHRSAWMDLGGIAKGYAVDRAVHALQERGVIRACVNAGGDLRFIGEGPHQVMIETERDGAAGIPALEVGAVAVATSTARSRRGEAVPHQDARARRPVDGDRLATVVAGHCVHADALTKLVLALGRQGEDLLRHYDAEAYLQDAAGEWIILGAATP